MNLKAGDKVIIKHKTREFYQSAIKLTVFKGVLTSLYSVYAEVKFDDDPNRKRTVLSGDLELAGNQQLLFDFYTE